MTIHIFHMNCPMCGRRLPGDAQLIQFKPAHLDERAAPLPEAGRILRNRYFLERRLGKGPVAKVFKAMDLYRSNRPEGGHQIAIKLQREAHDATDKRAEISSKLRREFLCTKSLSHRSAVKVYELDRDNDIAFFTMEFLDGETLSSALERLPRISIPRSSAWAIIREIGDGLAHAHSRNIAHGDLKLEDILITKSGELRILGYGAAPADPRDDLYALSCISYELLAGEPPFQRRISTEAQDLGWAAPRPNGLTRRQWQTLATGLSPRREERSISVSEWLVRLNPGRASERRLASFPPRYSERTVRVSLPSSRTIAMLAVLCFVVAICASINRASPDGKIRDAFDAPLTAANPLVDADPVMHDQNAQDGSHLQDSPAALQSTTAGVPLRKVKSHKLRMAADTYRIPSQEHFAEIRVRRSPGYGGDAAFVWWTEPSSAKPGIDYVPQARTTQFLPKGRDLASLFIKIIPNRSRKHAATFYVNIGDPRNGTPVRYLDRTAILLPPSI